MSINSDAMLERLTAVVHETIIDLVDTYGGATADMVAEEVCYAHADLKEIVGEEEIAQVVVVMLKSQLNIESGKYTAQFIELNREYFAERLPQFAVRVVYEPMHFDFRVDRECRTIHLRMAGLYEDHMLHRLIHAMAHLATNDEDGTEWQREMIRLRDVGAVPEWENSDCRLKIIHEAGRRIAVPLRSAHVQAIRERP